MSTSITNTKEYKHLQAVKRTIEKTAASIKQELSKPVYLEITTNPNGGFVIKQIEFLTPAQFAAIVHVEPRTVYTWIGRRNGKQLPHVTVPGSSVKLIDLNEALEWLRSDEIG